MQVPDYATETEFKQWARENKRRADRLARAVRAIPEIHMPETSPVTYALWCGISDAYRAAVEYESA